MTAPDEDAMQAVIADAYKAFGRYRLSGSVVVCNCPVCMTPETQAKLVSTPLRSIPCDLLAEYTNSAHGWDDGKIADDMRYFLPRYLELIAADDPPDTMGLDICLRRIGQADWRRSWQEKEAEVLHRFFDALMRHRLLDQELALWPVGWRLLSEIRDVLSLVVTAGGDLTRVLRAWDAAPDPGAAIHMAAARQRVKLIDHAWAFHSAYLETDHKDAANEIGGFLMRPEVAARLEAAFFTIEDKRLQQVVSDGLFA